MDIVISLILILIFSYLIINNFYNFNTVFNDVEGMECTLANFKRKSSKEIANLNGGDKELYDCQQKLSVQASKSESSLKQKIYNTEADIAPVRKSVDKFEAKFNGLRDIYGKWTKTKETRAVTLDNLYKFTNGKDTEPTDEHCEANPESCEDMDVCKENPSICEDSLSDPSSGEALPIGF